MIDLASYSPFDTKYIILEMLCLANLLAQVPSKPSFGDGQRKDRLTDDIHAGRVDNSTRQQVEVIFLITYDHCVSSVVSTLDAV